MLRIGCFCRLGVPFGPLWCPHKKSFTIWPPDFGNSHVWSCSLQFQRVSHGPLLWTLCLIPMGSLLWPRFGLQWVHNGFRFRGAYEGPMASILEERVSDSEPFKYSCLG